MRFRASPLVVAVAMGLLHPSVLGGELSSRKAQRAERAVATSVGAEPVATDEGVDAGPEVVIRGERGDDLGE
jgi:hypothetical protein